jgi:hypothetical protein
VPPANTTSPGRGENYQPFPSSGPLSSQLDLSFEQLRTVLRGAPRGSVYVHVVRTVEWRDRQFCQWGNSPNFQGDVITLCACKHQMRTSPHIRDHRPAWIAGVTSWGKAGGLPRRHLFYLMFVPRNGHFESQAQIWDSLEPAAREDKSASRSRVGDLYQPIRNGLVGREAFQVENYLEPCDGHSHHENHADTRWYGDIDYRGRGGRPSLLKGDERYSYLWTRPYIHWRSGQYDCRDFRTYDSMKDFVADLCPDAI